MKFKKTLILAPLAVIALSTSAFADDSSDMSYSVGYSMGKNLQGQLQDSNISIDNKELVSGLTDGIKGKDAKLSQDDMRKAMIDLQNQAMAAANKTQAK
ncbi:FKBP-type peptidyl-prolyl cis-trans isomerase N-terminal domain-containing protein [Pseudofrancisella aestuarii]|uniref:FKBP-type peptidyl-prolyl cis-trans isomerase N-terminal domain-containing protein n=1 Tax=Pseudofrancisella aestuarii TaxID=2670347 RepID=A0ABV9TA36_9GAMM|nr:FKBP-type peptidyl-prolyl cis-trans isomerase N-terminal domain-containing protein [Pseudofrancisella aestuarii]